MYIGVLIGVIIALIVGSLIKRMMELRATPFLLWPILLVTSAAPALVAYDVLNPRPAIDAEGAEISSVFVASEDDEVTLIVPDTGQYSVMATAHLAEYDEENPSSERTSYALSFQNSDWSLSVDDVIRRDTAGGGPDVVLTDGQGISESGTRRGTFGEQLQYRYELPGSGSMKVSVMNWEPETNGAAERLELQLFEAPPSKPMLWGLTCLVCFFCFILEIRNGCERLSNDVAFLLVWSVALRDGLTPLDSWQEVGSAALPALLIGFLGFGGISYVLMKMFGGRPSSEKGTGGKANTTEDRVDD